MVGNTVRDAPAGPLVAVVTPVYNGARFLAETMACVQAQTYANIVHYVLDNASTDATPNIIERFRNRRVPVVVAQNPETLPMLDNWNAALSLVPPNISYFRILPADDLMAPDCIEKMVAVCLRYPQVDIIGCQEWAGGVAIGTSLRPNQTVFDGRAIVRGSLLNEIHGFPHTHCLYRAPPDGFPTRFYDTEYYGTPLLSIDMDAAMRALSRSQYGFVHEPLVTTRLHTDSHTSRHVGPNFLKMWSELQLIDRWGPKVFDDYADYLKCRTQHLRFYYRHMALWYVMGKRHLFAQHQGLLRKASAEPTAVDYLLAVSGWPLRRIRRFAGRALVWLRIRSCYRDDW